MKTLTERDQSRVVAHIPKDVARLLRDNPGRLFLAGGFVREVIAGGEVKDIDLFGESASFLSITANVLVDARKKQSTLPTARHDTENAITVLTASRMPVQFITRWQYSKVESLLESFDFTVCQAVVWYGDGVWRSLVADTFYEDLAAHALVYTSPVREEEPGGSLLRALKFAKRGYHLQLESLGKVIVRLLAGVRRIEFLDDAERSKVICGLLREVDPMLVRDGWDLVGEDENESAN